MPCQGPPDPTAIEIQYHRLELLLKEVNTGEDLDVQEYHCSMWNNARQSDVDALTRELCDIMQKCDKELIPTFSLELQTWWRDHQAWDKKREKTERENAAREAAKKTALNKLTPADRRALGL